MNFQKIRMVGFTGCFLVLGVCIVISFTKYGQLNAERSQLQNAEEELQKQRIEIAQAKQLMEEYDKEREEFAQYLFNERNIPSFLDEVSKIATDSRVNISDMKTLAFHQVVVSSEFQVRRYGSEEKPKAPTAQEARQKVLTLSAMPITMSLKGQFKDLAVFLDKIQSYKQLVSVTNMNINPSAYPVLNCRFTLNIYSLKTLSELK